MRKWESLLVFYRSILPINLAIVLVFMLAFGPVEAAISFFTLGYLCSILYAGLRLKPQFLFYYNNKLSKIQLFVASWIINFAIGLLGLCAIVLWKISWT